MKEVQLTVPKDGKLPAVAGKWVRLPGGGFIATYTQDELALCAAIVGDGDVRIVRAGQPVCCVCKRQSLIELELYEEEWEEWICPKCKKGKK